jgi:hypothetical protein
VHRWTTVPLLALALAAAPTLAGATPTITLTGNAEGPKTHDARGTVSGMVYKVPDSPFRDCGLYSVMVRDVLAVVEVKAKTEAKISIVRDGRAIDGLGLILSDLERKKYECTKGGRTSIAKILQPGRYEVYLKALRSALTAGQKGDASAIVRVDVAAPPPPKPPPVVVADPLTRAPDIQRAEFVKGSGQVVVQTVEAPAGSIRAKCGPSHDWSGGQPYFVFPDEASLEIDFARPTGDVVIEYASVESTEVAHHVTYANGRTSCFPLEDDSPRNFGTGRMATDPVIPDGPVLVRVGFIEKKPRPRVTVVIRERKTPIDALAVMGDIPNEIPLAERYTNRWVPLMTLTWNHAEDLSLLFEKLPRSLWVYARYDFDKDVVKPTWLGGMSGPTEEDLLAVKYPKKNEPLLLVAEQTGTAVISADGNRYRLKSRSAVVDAPDGEPVFPAKARNVTLDLDEGSEHADAKLVAAVAKHKKRAAKAEACWFKTVKKLGGFTSRGVKMYEVTYRNGEVVSVQDYGNKVSRRASKKCGVNRYRKAEEKLLRRLHKSYDVRAKKRLAAIAAKAN